ELTLRTGASIGAIAQEHGVSRTGLTNWRALYRAGKLEAQGPPWADASTAGTTFLPVSLASARKGLAPILDARLGRALVEVDFASGATMRIKTNALDVALVGALVAELRR
ncbi:MAG: transposase, partial [Candidatus Dormibacteria bacterium]